MPSSSTNAGMNNHLHHNDAASRSATRPSTSAGVSSSARPSTSSSSSSSAFKAFRRSSVQAILTRTNSTRAESVLSDHQSTSSRAARSNLNHPGARPGTAASKRSEDSSFDIIDPPRHSHSPTASLSLSHSTSNHMQPDPSLSSSATGSATGRRSRSSTLFSAFRRLNSTKKPPHPLSSSSTSTSTSHYPSHSYPGSYYSGANGFGAFGGKGVILPDVIEIAPAPSRREEEDAERERLRAAAAESIGMPAAGLDGLNHSLTSHPHPNGMDAMSYVGSIDETDEDWYDHRRMHHNGTGAFDFEDGDDDDAPAPRHPYAAPTPPMPSAPVPVSLAPPAAPANGRLRSGSLAQALSRARSSSRAGASAPVPSPLTASTLSDSDNRGAGDGGGGGIPPFPATPAQLARFSQLQGAFPKHCPPASVLMPFGRQWKRRFVVLSAPLPAGSGGGGGGGGGGGTGRGSSMKSYLHVFKGMGSDERELERLAVDEASVVFVAGDEVGRKGVLKVGGLDATVAPANGNGLNASTSSSQGGRGAGGGAGKKDADPEDEGRAMWLLQIVDQTESQRWIDAIKNAVLSQRTVRAGLGYASHTAHTSGPSEPRGDMDVQFTMRKTGLLPSSLASAAPTGTAAYDHHTASSRGSSATPPHSVRSAHSNAALHANANAPASPPPLHSNVSSISSAGGRPLSAPSAVLSLKGLFSVRPRSPSVASHVVTVASDPDNDAASSFGVAGDHIRGFHRGAGSTLSSPTSPTFSTAMNPAGFADAPAPAPAIDPQALELKIVQHHRSAEWTPRSAADGLREREASDGSLNRNRAGSLSLLPPPRPNRRPWTSGSVLTAQDQSGSGSGRSTPRNIHTRVDGEDGETKADGGHGENQSPPTSARTSLEFAPRSAVPSHSPTPQSSPLPASTPRSSEDGSRLSPPSTGLAGFSFFGTPEQRPRAPSVSSVSTLASGEQQGTSRGSRRWSRHALPKMLTPPAGPLPPVPSAGSSSGGGTERGAYSPSARSRASSVHSPASPASGSASSPPQRSTSFSKRASVSGSSVRSVNTMSTSHSHGAHSWIHSNGNGSVNGHEPGSSPPADRQLSGPPTTRLMGLKRLSLPPPSRPPNSALPPTPGHRGSYDASPAPVRPSSSGSGSAPRSPPRSIIPPSRAHRALRLSLLPPTLPPSAALPPRPDEPSTTGRGFRGHHRRSSSVSNVPTLTPISGSPVIPAPTHPMPIGKVTAPVLSRGASFKQRLRLLSNPGSTSSPTPSLRDVPAPPPFVPAPAPDPLSSRSSSPMLAPSTPIGEPIMVLCKDSDLLADNESRSIALTVPDSSPTMPETTPLSPPPRRGSRQLEMRIVEHDQEDAAADPPPEKPAYLRLSHQDSAFFGAITQGSSPPL